LGTSWHGTTWLGYELTGNPTYNSRLAVIMPLKLTYTNTKAYFTLPRVLVENVRGEYSQ